MNTQDDRSGRQDGMGSQQDTQQGFQQGAGTQQGGQPQQYSSGGSQQGGASGPYGASGGQHGGAVGQQGSQQDQYSPTRSQQGGALGRRAGGTPTLFGGRGGPFEMLRRLDEDMDRLFNQFWGGSRNLLRGRGAEAPSMWMPQVEMREQGGKLHVYADLPGLRKEDVKLSVEGDQLILQGERRSSHEEGQQGSDFYHTERSYGSFYRSIPLPEGVDAQNVEANFRDGVLDVSFDAPRRPQQQARQIEIREGGAGASASSGSSGTGNRSSGQGI